MKQEINELIKEIVDMQDTINKKIFSLQKLIKEQSMKQYNIKNKEAYIYYLRQNDKKENSIEAYLKALEIIRKLLKEYVGYELDNEIYYIDDLEFFNEILYKFENSSDINLINLKHHHMYSAAIHNYGKFLNIIKE